LLSNRPSINIIEKPVKIAEIFYKARYYKNIGYPTVLLRLKQKTKARNSLMKKRIAYILYRGKETQDYYF
jgi:hypothetical protein